MADNTVLSTNVGTGDTIATDDIGGIKFPRGKLTLGADGANDGDVSTSNPMPIGGPAAQDAAVSGNPLLCGARASAAAPTDMSADGDAVDVWALRSGAVATQPTYAGILAVAGNGAAGTGVQRVTIANDSTGILAAVTAITNALPAGNNNIGDVDVASVAGTVTVGGVAAQDAAVSGNPVLVGARASAAVPTDMSADGDAVDIWALRSGAIANQPTYAGVLAVAGNGASGTGVQRVTIANDSTGILATVTNVTTVATVTTLTGGGIAHDSADSGNPIKIGAKAETSPKGITTVADGDRSDLYCDSDGLLMVKLNTANGDIISERVTNTNGTDTAFSNFSAVASTRNYVTAITVMRSDAGTTPASVDFRDGVGGTVLWTMPLPPNGGSVIASSVPLFRTSANTALSFDVSAALTTVTISVSGFQSKV